MGARSAIGVFSFPSPRGCLSPSSLAGELSRLNRFTSILAGALFVSLLGTAWLAHLAAIRADVLPYVADGGVFGCAVRVLPSPPSGQETPEQPGEQGGGTP